MEIRRLLLRGVAASLCLTAAVAIYALLAGEFDDTEVRVLSTTAAISGYGLLAAPFPPLLERGHGRMVGLAGLALTALGFLLALVLIWRDWDGGGDGPWQAWIVLTAFAGGFSQTASLLARRLHGRDPVAGIRGVAIGLGFVVAALVSAAAVVEIDDEGFYRALGAMAVLDVLALAMVPVLTRLRRNDDGERFRCTLADGTTRDVEASGFDDAARRASGMVRAVERL